MTEPLTEDLGDVRVVHVRAGLEDLPAFVARPDHESVHRPLDVRPSFAVLLRLADDLRAQQLVRCSMRVRGGSGGRVAEDEEENRRKRLESSCAGGMGDLRHRRRLRRLISFASR